jgi:hypothetical protein
MKNEEFNEFLKNRADGFEMKPSSGSFDAMLNKLNKKSKRKRVAIWSSLLAACVAGILCFSLFNTTNTTNTDNTIAGNTNNTPNRQKTDAGIQNEESIKNTEQKKDINSTTAATQADNKITNSPAQKTKNTVNKGSETSATIVTTPPATNKQDIEPTVDVTKLLDADLQNAQSPLQTIADNESVDGETPVANIEALDTLPGLLATDDDAQNDKSKNKTIQCNCDSKWALQAYYNPFASSYYRSHDEDISSYSLKKYNTFGQGGTTQAQSYSLTENPRSGFEVGLRVARKIGKHVSLVSGLGYNSWKIKIVETSETNNVDSIENYGIDPVTNQPRTYFVASFHEELYKQTTTTITYNSIQLPVFAQYQHNIGNWGILAQAGVSLGYTFGAVKNESTYVRSDTASNATPFVNSSADVSSVADETGYRAFNLNLSSSIAVSYKLSKCIDVYAGPRIAASMLSYNQKGNNTEKLKYPAFLGIETGIKLNL